MKWKNTVKMNKSKKKFINTDKKQIHKKYG